MKIKNALAVLLFCSVSALAEGEPQLRYFLECRSSRPIDGDNSHLPGQYIAFALDGRSYASMPNRRTGYAFVQSWDEQVVRAHNLSLGPNQDGSASGTISLTPADEYGAPTDWGRYPGLFHIPPASEGAFVMEIREPLSQFHDRRWDILQCDWVDFTHPQQEGAQ